MTKKIEVYFAGLARDCEGVLDKNLSSILEICEHPLIQKYELWIAENDSIDRTRDILKKYEISERAINICLFDNLDVRFPNLETRLAYLRDFLLDEIKNKTVDRKFENPCLYIPIDLDSQIAQTVDKKQFIRECIRIASGKSDAIFPVSKPYYYDIRALRKKGWVETDCWNKVRKSSKSLGSFREEIKHVYSKQKPIEELQKVKRIPVQSAFGGIGIYNIDALQNANYKQDEVTNYPHLCEHVVFNRSVKSKEISTRFVIQAPKEHITFKTSPIGKIQIAIKSILKDIKQNVLPNPEKLCSYAGFVPKVHQSGDHKKLGGIKKERDKSL